MAFKYTKMKIFHYIDKLNSLPLSNKSILPPIHIRIKPTNFCNHSCSYCAYRNNNLQLGLNMEERDFIPKMRLNEIIEDLIEMRVKAVTFSGGGEPFCYPFLTQAIELLAKSQIKFASLTNGSLVIGKNAELFAKYGSWLRVSIDGWDEESYSKFRSVPFGEFSKVMKNMEHFKKLNGDCHLGVSIIVGKENAEHIFDLSMKLKKIGVDSIKISPRIISNSGVENNIYHEPIFEKVKSQISLLKKECSSDFEVYDSFHLQLETFEKNYTWCPYHQILAVIGADLNIYPCQDKAYNLETGLIGTIKNKRFKDFWFSDKNNFFKINPSLVCNHHCVANEKNKMIIEYLDADKEHLEFV
ncbi:MAG TPA: radical SAM protein [Candidatus Woesearchaeota archaeon]|nr:radical SAM protein [Candidatus Woesearchaeota archaeon]